MLVKKGSNLTSSAGRGATFSFFVQIGKYWAMLTCIAYVCIAGKKTTAYKSNNVGIVNLIKANLRLRKA